MQGESSVEHKDELVSAAVYAREHEPGERVAERGTDEWVEEDETRARSGSEGSRGDRHGHERDHGRRHRRHHRREKESKKSATKSKTKSKTKTRSTKHSKGPTEESRPVDGGDEGVGTRTTAEIPAQTQAGRIFDPIRQAGTQGSQFGGMPPNGFQPQGSMGGYASLAQGYNRFPPQSAPGMGGNAMTQPGTMPWGQANNNEMRGDSTLR